MAIAPSLEAHGGHGHDTEARIYPDRMRVVLRTSVDQAWRFLGERAPLTRSEADTATALSLLARMAPELLEVTSQEGAMTPRSAECMMEPDHHVAFVLKFDRPPDGTLRLEARFTDRIDGLEAGTVAVFDHTAAPFRRDIAPLASGEFSRHSPTFACAIGSSASLSPPPAGDPATGSEPSPDRGTGLAWILGILGIAWLAFSWRRGRR